MSFSTIAVINYFLKKASKDKIKLNKTKLMHLIIYAHIMHVTCYDRALLAEKLSLMHFGFILKSFEKYFAKLEYDEDITAIKYAACEKACKIKLRNNTMELECKDKMLLDFTQRFLNKIFTRFDRLSTSEAVSVNIGPCSVWYEIACKYKGSHLITDYTPVSNKLLLTLGRVGLNSCAV